MYQPQHYKNDGSGFIYKFIQEYPFATIVLQGENLLATHVPILTKGEANDFRLYAHIADHNPMHGFLKDGCEMLAIFKGPDAYVSASWYSGPEIPTWDYVAVHINARLYLQTESELRDSLVTLIDYFERDSQNPLKASDIPSGIWDENFSEITGFWLDPFQMKGVEKLHQNFNSTDIENVSRQLMNKEGCGHAEVARLLRKKHKLR